MVDVHKSASLEPMHFGSNGSGVPAVDEPAGRVMALLKLEARDKFACVQRMFTDEHVDLVDAVEHIPRKKNPLHVHGLHRRAFIAMEEFAARENAEFLIRRTWWRDSSELCRDDRCLRWGVRFRTRSFSPIPSRTDGETGMAVLKGTSQ